ncbi:hypothetical protein VTN96DRAFT_5408 [Rasamsonia emersonii]
MSPMVTGFDPYTYTSGHWLRHDKLERDLRYIKFDFDALCRGLSRRVVVARLLFAIAGPPKLSTTSEVATIKYLQAKTSIPIPKILDWSNDASSNPIGSEYIIMEHAAGVQLHKKWPDMTGDQQVKCIGAIYRKVKEMVDLEFPAYGSLYFVDNNSLLDYSASSFKQQPLDDGEFCIGPRCGARYWDCNNAGEPRYYHNTKPNHGPW